jgi:membrane-bound inhibitor of C-type lysozyme
MRANGHEPAHGSALLLTWVALCAVLGAGCTGGGIAARRSPGPIGRAPAGVEGAVRQMVCGDERVSVRFSTTGIHLTVSGQTYALRQVPAASGARYESVADASTSFWSRGAGATLVVRGETFAECTPAPEAEGPAPTPDEAERAR